MSTDFDTFIIQTIAQTVGDWYYSRNVSKEIDCAYPCDTTCHNMIQSMQRYAR